MTAMTSTYDPRWSAQALSALVGDALQQAAPVASRAQAALAAWTDIDAWRPWRSAAAAFVDDAQLARAATLRQRDEQERRLLTYALHRLVVAHWLQRPPWPLEIGRDVRGCPRLPGGVASTSLSHAGAFSAFAVCPSAPVGIDLEVRPSRVDLVALAHRIAHPGDLAEIDAGGIDGRQQRLLALWVRKEACLKAAGVGLTHPMEAFAAGLDGHVVLPALVRPGHVPPVQVQPLHVQLRMLPSPPAWVGAVALPLGVEVRMIPLLPPVD